MASSVILSKVVKSQISEVNATMIHSFSEPPLVAAFDGGMVVRTSRSHERTPKVEGRSSWIQIAGIATLQKGKLAIF